MDTMLLLIVTTCYVLVTVVALCRLAVFVLSLRAKVAPAWVPAVRAVCWLLALFALPRIQPHTELNFGVLVLLLVWELIVLARQERNRGEAPGLASGGR